MFSGGEAASILYDLMDQTQRNDAKSRIRQEYHLDLPQETSTILRNLEPGTAHWLWSRGVPNNLKSSFFKQCADKRVVSAATNLLEMIASHLTSTGKS